MDLRNLREIAEKVTEVLFPLAEVALYTKPSGREVICLNRLGDTQDEMPQNGVERLSDGRALRRADIPIFDDKGEEIALFRIRADLTLFSKLHKQLDKIVKKETKSVLSWQDQIETMIEKFLSSKGIRLSAASRREKRELIYFLHTEGAFRYKEAANFLASKLDLSRATVYNYLKWATQVSQLNIHKVDAFTEKRFSGNPAGVVLDAEDLAEETMKKITREINLSETAFVLPSDKGQFRLRYFTPTGDEVKFCGHSTVGALYMLAHEGKAGISGPGHYDFAVETRAGLVNMEVDIDEKKRITAIYDAPPIQLEFSLISAKETAYGLGISLSSIDASQPIMYEKTNNDLFVSVPSLEMLKNIEINTKEAAKFGKDKGIVAFCLFTQETFDPQNQVHVRCFAPTVGINEDPFTGSILGGLASYLTKNKMATLSTLGVEQGHFMGRPGHVKVKIIQTGGQVQAKIIAKAMHLFSSKIELQ